MNETRRTRRPLPVAAIRTAFPLLAFLFAAGRMNALETIDLVDHDRTVTFTREILRLVETSTGDVLLERELPVESAVGAGLTQVIDLPDRQVVAVSTGSRIRLLDVTRTVLSGPTQPVAPPGEGADASDGVIVGVRVSINGRVLAVGTCCTPGYRLYDISRTGTLEYAGHVVPDYPFPYDYWQSSPAPVDGFVLRLDPANYDPNAAQPTASALSAPPDSGFDLVDISADLARQARRIHPTDPIWYTLPYGWSPDGRLATITVSDRYAAPGVHPDPDRRMWAHAERVQNLITDDIEQSRWEMVYPPIRDSISDRPRTDVVAAARRIVSCWQPSVDQLRASGFEPVADLSLRTAPLPDGLSLDLRLERGTDGAVRAYRLTAHRAGVGFKEVSASNAGSYHGPLELSSDWARILDMRVVGILQSPFERRVAVVVGVRRQLVADRSTWIEFMIVGCHLDIGFHP